MNNLKLKVFFSLAIIILALCFPKPILADCDDPACQALWSRHYCGFSSAGCHFTGTSWFSETAVDHDDCSSLNGGAGCDASEPCVWHAVWTAACDGCGCTSFDGKDNRFQIYITAEGTPGEYWGHVSGHTDVDPECVGGGCGMTEAGPGPYFYTYWGGRDSGNTNVVLDRNNADAQAYQNANWWVQWVGCGHTVGELTGESGTGFEASLDVSMGDWCKQLFFEMTDPIVNFRLQVTSEGDHGSYDPSFCSTNPSCFNASGGFICKNCGDGNYHTCHWQTGTHYWTGESVAAWRDVCRGEFTLGPCCFANNMEILCSQAASGNSNVSIKFREEIAASTGDILAQSFSDDGWLGGQPITCTLTNPPEGFDCINPGGCTTITFTPDYDQDTVDYTFQLGVAEGAISGTAYDVSNYPNVAAGAAACTGDTVSGVQVDCTGGSCGAGDSRTTDGSGNYSFTELDWDNYNLVASILNPEWSQVFFCNNASTATTVTVDSNDTVTRNIGVMQGISEGWWQASSGDIHADSSGGGDNIDSAIPDTCADIATCNPYILANSEDDILQGLLTHTNGTIDAGEGDEAESGWELTSDYTGDLTDYDYFYSLAQDYDVLPEEEWDGEEPTEDVNYVYSDDTTIDIDQAWLSDYDKKAVFYFGGGTADNDVTLNINDNVSLASGGFVGFIVDGNVNISSDVEGFEGVIIADGRIAINSTGSNDDNQFNGQGMFIAWSGFDLNRNLGFDAGGGDNRTSPAELFTYDPELMFSAPSALKKPNYTWVEVTP